MILKQRLQKQIFCLFHSTALGMRMIRRLHQANQDLSVSRAQLVAERTERDASVSALEAALKKLKEEHMLAKVHLVYGNEY
jgi:multidrug resistance efflux pump